MITYIIIYIPIVRFTEVNSNISLLEKFSVHIVYHYFISYSSIVFVIIKLYCSLKKSFNKYTKSLLIELLIMNTGDTTLVHFEMVRFYMKIYIYFETFVDYPNPNFIICIITTILVFIHTLTLVFYYFAEHINYYSVQLLCITAILMCISLFTTEEFFVEVSIFR